MGKEILHDHFSVEDELVFLEKLKAETSLLDRWFKSKKFHSNGATLGLELEAWLVTPDFVPSPKASDFVKSVDNPLVVPEISCFNFELNTEPYPISSHVFSSLENDLSQLWKKCDEEARLMGLKTLMIGTLPTLRMHMLSLEQLTPHKRYMALNNRIMQLRSQSPVELDIQGRDQVRISHDNILVECAGTSMQIHYSIPIHRAAKYYNASIISSAFIVAASANSPFFMGKEVWDESRIAIFEQSVNVMTSDARGKRNDRVSLGLGYVKNCLMELFTQNLESYGLLLPEINEQAELGDLEHLRMQNGCIWRWNRPLIGFDQEGRPCLRLELRVPSAGPTIKDIVANMVLQIALIEYLVEIDNLEEKIPFEKAQENFYQAARHGLDAKIYWTNGKVVRLQELLFQEILPACLSSLENLGIEHSEAHYYLHEIVASRIKSGQNGANWQKAYVHTHGSRFQELLETYHHFQNQNLPVHHWKV